ncbi:MAG: hypothetical protein NC311_04340 [Muribaculaceae bacterium]|nr:hypothetical protein [Muribaculaceae bacterium]
MKKHIGVFLVMLMYCPLAFADGTISRVIPTSANSSGTTTSGVTTRTTTDATQTKRSDTQSQSRTATRGSTASNTTQSNTSASSIIRSGARTVNLNKTSTDSARTRNATTSDASVRDNLIRATSTSGRNARVSAASINNNPALRRAGVTLRPTTAEVGGRATISETGTQTGSNVGSEVRALQSRAATTTTRETIAEAKERLEQTADLNKSCQEQYNDCMDQFCAVIDSNQKRCSCSANLSRYTKVEDAVKEANTKLNDVAQRIRYVGLSADEIRAIMSETEAEEELSGKTDTSETRNMLTQIEKMIKDPTSTTSYSADTSFGLDMDLDFSGDLADMFSLDFLNTGTTSFSNLRGTELYNAAKKRCNTVLNQCKNAGGTPQQITGNYDLAIDKDCIAYEQGLKKMNETLTSNVRSANLMLQKARLAVLQNKNQYDAKGCIAALDTCMKDDMVCGEDYTKCLDPTKKYIDENGDVVLGQNITDITSFMYNYNNANINKEFIINSLSQSMTPDKCKVTCTTGEDKVTKCETDTGTGACTVRYLMEKIGTGDKATDNGLCRPVLDKCQYYTYDASGKYKKDNDIVVNYIQRAMVNIKAAQQKIISDYASSCMVDIANCYNQQVSQVNTWSSNASVSSIYRVMNGACYNVALTCAYAVFADIKDQKELKITCNESNKLGCIQGISEMFYQSLLCPDNSTYQIEGDCTTPDNGEKTCSFPTQPDANGQEGGWVNVRCKCKAGYEVWGTQCLAVCKNGSRNDYGVCETTKTN